MNNWEKFKIVVTAISALMAAMAAFIIPFKVEKALKEREIQTKYVEQALDILKRPPVKEYQGVRTRASKSTFEY